MKRLLTWMVVVAVTIVLHDTPPEVTKAFPVNKATQTEQVAKPTTPIEAEKRQKVEPKPAVKKQPQVEAPQPEAVQETVPEPVKPIGCSHYDELLKKYDWNVTTMTKVMQAESGCNPNSIGDTRVIGGIYAPSCGLFQVRTLKGRPSCAELQDPATNIAWAYRIYQGQGYKAWSVCKTKVDCY